MNHNDGRDKGFVPHESYETKSFFVDGVLHQMPAKPIEPQKVHVVYEPTNTFFRKNDTLEDMMKRLPRGTSLRDLELVTTDDGRVTFHKKTESSNVFYEEELKIFYAKLAIYESELKLWHAKVEAYRSRLHADGLERFDDAFDKGKVRHTVNPREDRESRELAKEWLQSIERPEQSVPEQLTDQAIAQRGFLQSLGLIDVNEKKLPKIVVNSPPALIKVTKTEKPAT